MKKPKNNILKISIAVIIIIIIGFLIGFYLDNIEEKKEISNTIETDIINGEVQDLSGDIISGGSLEEENNLEVEGFIESNPDMISGTSRDNEELIIGNSQVTNKPVYYSQIDSRWKNIPYTSTGNSSQTIGSSGCGPTSAAMIVAGLKDSSVTPITMADLYVRNGFRSANDGTYASAFKWTANRYNIPFKQLYNVNDAIQAVRDGYYLVVSCSNGLFTTGGHYIVICGIDGNTLKIYDPYLYGGKFDISSRRGKVQVSGNTVYCSVSNFKAYANSKGWYAFKGNSAQPTPTPQPKYYQGQRVLIDNKVMIAYDGGGPEILLDNTLNQFWLNRSVVTPDSRVYGLATVVWDEGARVLVQIFETQFWTSSSSISTQIPQSNNNSSEQQKETQELPSIIGYSLGKYVTNSNLNVRTGPNTNYRIIKTYKKGTRFDTREIRGDWARTPSGWVNLNYCTLVYKY